MNQITPSEFGYERLSSIDDFAAKHFDYVSSDKYWQYWNEVKDGEIFCFAIFKDGERVGTTLAEITVSIDGKKKLICLETGGEKDGYNFDQEYLGFYLAIANVLECEIFVVNTYRESVVKMAKKAGFKLAYAEYEIEVEKYGR